MDKWTVAFITFYDKNGRILLNHRFEGESPNEDVWELMGGSIDGNEKPITAIKREVKEELNYDVSEEKDDLEFVRKSEFTENNRLYEVYFFKAKFPGFQYFSDSKEVKVADLKLFSIDEALTLPLLPIAEKILLEIK